MQYLTPDLGVTLKQRDSYQELKQRLHRFLIDAIEDDGVDIGEWVRPSVTHYVTEKIARYVADAHLAVSQYDLDRLGEEMVDELVGYGPLQALLADERITEVLVNGSQHVFVEKDGKLRATDFRFIDDNHVLRVVHRILSPLGRRLDESSPMVDARLPDGSRINAIIPPLALDGPCVSIRKFSKGLLKTSDLIAAGSLDEAMLGFLQRAVTNRCNILVSGGTGSGKTTLLNILSSFAGEDERIVTIEDTGELRLAHSHVVRLESRPPNVEGFGEVTSRDLVRNALRMRPDRIILGEVRGDEVLDVLQAMNTGHDGSMSTVHANTAEDALLRLEMLISLASQRMAEATARRMIAAAIDLIVHLGRLPDGRRTVLEIRELAGIRDGVYVSGPLYAFDRSLGRCVQAQPHPSTKKLQEAWGRY